MDLSKYELIDKLTRRDVRGKEMSLKLFSCRDRAHYVVEVEGEHILDRAESNSWGYAYALWEMFGYRYSITGTPVPDNERVVIREHEMASESYRKRLEDGHAN